MDNNIFTSNLLSTWYSLQRKKPAESDNLVLQLTRGIITILYKLKDSTCSYNFLLCMELYLLKTFVLYMALNTLYLSNRLTKTIRPSREPLFQPQNCSLA